MRPFSVVLPIVLVVLSTFAVIVPSDDPATSASFATTSDPAPFSGFGPHLADAWQLEPEIDVPDLSLADAVSAFDARLGVTRAPDAFDVLDTLDPVLASAAAHLLSALLAAAMVRDDVYAGVSDHELLALLETETDPRAVALAGTLDGARMASALAGVAAVLDTELPRLILLSKDLPAARGLSAPIDLAPALIIDAVGGDDFHTRDAVLVIEIGGNDVYDTNAGGALIHQGLVGNPGSCQNQILGLSVACENEDSFQSFTASLLVDLGGDDTYGVKKAPRPGSRDTLCTTAPIIRRVVMGGAASGGAGMLVDVAGNDLYQGKTLAFGHGHIAGAGALFDLSGDDTYNLIRSGIGSGILQGSGAFVDLLGSDTYTFAAPPGGLWNVDQGRCDSTARLGLGAGVLQATGHFLDRAGNDVYRVGSQAFGFASGQGAGGFVDLGGTDDYGGYPARGNDMQVAAAGFFLDRDLFPTQNV